MDARYAVRKTNCSKNARVDLKYLSRLSTSTVLWKPFVKTFQDQMADQHAKTYVSGLLSNVGRGKRRVGLRTFLASPVCRFKPSLAGMHGTMRHCDLVAWPS